MTEHTLGDGSLLPGVEAVPPPPSPSGRLRGVGCGRAWAGGAPQVLKTMKKGGKCRARITGEKWLGSLAAKVSKSEKDAVSAQKPNPRRGGAGTRRWRRGQRWTRRAILCLI